MTDYYFVPLMMSPYWAVDETAWNADSDTDMGDLGADEFHQYFPHAVKITREQFDERSVGEDQELDWFAEWVNCK